jgi:hypothetical protein
MFMNSQLIGSVLRSLRDLEASLVRVKRLTALQRLYAQSVPRELARKSRVAYEREGTVVVTADNGAVAAKLRHLAPRIVLEIVKSVPEVTGIRVEVQVTQPPAARPEPPVEIGPKGLANLRELRDSLPASPLKAALDRLVSRREKLNRQDQALHGEEGEHN